MAHPREVGFCVEDTGPGIPEQEFQFIFGRFYRGAVGQETGTPGTGLGLTIAKEIIDRNGGRIDVENVGNGTGARFTVWLPAMGESLHDNT